MNKWIVITAAIGILFLLAILYFIFSKYNENFTVDALSVESNSKI